jgi:hypothetical protein
MSSRLLPIFLGLGFFLVALNVFISSKPSLKAPIYKEIKEYSPYYLEKRFGGLEIRKKGDENFKEKPSNQELFHELSKLEREWGRDHLRAENGELLILDDSKKLIKKIPIKSQENREFLKNYYGI